MAGEATVFAIKFKNDFILRVQQSGSRLKETVRNDPDFLEGKYGYFDRIGATTTQIKATRHGDTPILGTNYDRRRLLRDTRNWGDMVDRSDIERMMKNPINRITENARKAFNRTVDDYIIAAATGAAFSIDQDDNSSNVALPAANIIGQGGGAGMTLAKALAALENLDHNEVDEEEERTIVVTAHQITQMLNVAAIQPTTSQYILQIEQLQQGKIDYFARFHWVRSERLLLDPAAPTYRMVLAYAKRGIGVAPQGEPFTRVTERSDKQFNWQAYLEFEIGATRIEDECVMQVDCLEP